MSIDLTKLTLDVATLHKLAVDQHDLLTTLRAQITTAQDTQGVSSDTAAQAAIDALDATVRDAEARLTATLVLAPVPVSPAAPDMPPQPIPATTPAPAPSGAPTGVEVAAKPD